jgi:hypothetical protein
VIELKDEVLCSKCGRAYPPDLITGIRNGQRETLSDIRAGIFRDESEQISRSKRLLARAAGRTARDGTKRVGIERLKDWTFYCPGRSDLSGSQRSDGEATPDADTADTTPEPANGPHRVDGNAGLSFPVAVIGRSGASKSHFVPALPWELRILATLDELDVVLEDPVWKGPDDPDLTPEINNIFIHHRVPISTRAAVGVRGPYAYRLTVDRGLESERLLSLFLFDTPGEFFENLNTIATYSPYIVLARSVVILLDPDGLVVRRGKGGRPSPKDSALAITDAIALITRVADAFREEFHSDEFPVPVCIALAKADSIVTDFRWNVETERVISEFGEGRAIRDILVDSSSRAREEFLNLGLERIVRAIEAKFPSDGVRYCFSSATSESATIVKPDSTDPSHQAQPFEAESDERMATTYDPRRKWVNPTPNGVGMSLLQVLDMTFPLENR